jgi:toxin YoeB
MRVVWASDAWNQYLEWQRTDLGVVKKLNELIEDTRRRPFQGLGKPEPLRGPLQGWWSRRITGEHRLVYRVSGKGDQQQLEIAQCRWHYR